MVPDEFVDCRLKTLTVRFVHTEPASIFALFTWEQTNLAELYLFQWLFHLPMRRARPRIFLPLSKLKCSPQKINSREIRLHLTISSN